MAEVLLFHHAQGKTRGYMTYADASLPSCRLGAAASLTERVLEFLRTR
jgi:hypothetical protein